MRPPYFAFFLWFLQAGCFYFRQDYIDWMLAVKCAVRWHDWWVCWFENFVECERKFFKNFVYCFYDLCRCENDNGVRK